MFRAKNIEFKHLYIKQLYENIINVAINGTSTEWKEQIPTILTCWERDMQSLVA